VIGNQPNSQNALTTTLVVLQAFKGQLTGLVAVNPNAGTVYLQFFDAAVTTGITLGTTAPYYSLALAAGYNNLDSLMFNHFHGIVVAATTTPTGSTAPGSNVLATFGTRFDD